MTIEATARANATQHDGDILAGISRREEESLRRAIEMHGSALLGVALSLTGDRHVAEEITQDAFIALWDKPDRVDRQKGSLRAFLIGIVRHKSIDRLRAAGTRARTWERVAALSPPSHVVDIGFDEASAERQRMTAALSRLTPTQREAIVLAYFGGRTYREVARELGTPEGTAKSRLRDGLAALRRELVGTEELDVPQVQLAS